MLKFCTGVEFVVFVSQEKITCTTDGDLANLDSRGAFSMPFKKLGWPSFMGSRMNDFLLKV
jgi:hypothetical protein